jgi:magnesium transporter
MRQGVNPGDTCGEKGNRMNTNDELNDAIEWIVSGLERGEVSLPINANHYSALDWALIYEATPARLRAEAWPLLPQDNLGAILAAMRDDVRRLALTALSEQELIELANKSSSDEIIDFIEYLPKTIARGILKRLSAREQDQVTSALAYGDQELGRLVAHDVLVVADNAIMADVILDLRNLDESHHIDKIYVVDASDRLVGSLDVRWLAIKPRRAKIADIMETDIEMLSARMDPAEAIRILQGSEESHLPVIDDVGQLLGVFSYLQALQVSQQNFEEQLSHRGNVSDEDLFAPVINSSRKRAIWLGLNLVTAFMAAAVISLFEATIAEVVALAVLMPIVASMGGIAGSQTLTLTIRGLAVGQLSDANTRALGKKELLVSLLNGLLWALVVGTICSFWFDSWQLAAIIAFAIVINMLVAALSGITIPILLTRAGVDPALAGAVILTTVTDVVGFFVFLGLATLILL